MANASIQVTQLDFQTLRDSLKNFLRSQSEISDYDFEGSGMAVLLDILAYNTSYAGFYANMIGNEMFLDSAQLRNSVVSLSKLLNYRPRSRTAASAVVDVTVTPGVGENQSLTTLTLDRWTRFLGSDISGTNYTFVSTNSYTVPKLNGSFFFPNVSIQQGDPVTRQYLMTSDNTTRRFRIPSANADTTTLQITTQASATNNYTTIWTLNQDITEITSTDTVYFLEEDAMQTWSFYFGDGILGRQPDIGNVITAAYLDTAGDDANKTQKFTLIDPAGGVYNQNIGIVTRSTAFGGAEKESLEEIRFRAPYFYSMQNRAIIGTDYEEIILKKYPFITSVSVWGGETANPPVYGKVFISATTQPNYQLTAADKLTITNDLISTTSVLTVFPEFIDPDYVYLQLKGNITYNPSLTNLSAGQIGNLVRASISNYASQNLNKFRAIFRLSDLQQIIYQADQSITGADLDVIAQKRVNIVPLLSYGYTLNFNTSLRKGDTALKLTSFPAISINDSGGISRKVLIEEVPSSSTGIGKVTIVNPGAGYTSPPVLTITGDGTGATAVATLINGQIQGVTITNPGVNYSFAKVTITGGGGAGAVLNPVVSTQLGTIRAYYVRSDTQEKVIVQDPVGTISYDTGVVVISPLTINSVDTNSFYDVNVLTIDAPTQDTIIYPGQKYVISIDPSDSSAVAGVNIVAENS